jgi:virulence-associated protein VagC
LQLDVTDTVPILRAGHELVIEPLVATAA